MHPVLLSVLHWVFAHAVKCCIPIPDEFDYSSRNALGVFNELFADGDFNWGRKVIFATWCKKSFGNIKGFQELCNVMRTQHEQGRL